MSIKGCPQPDPPELVMRADGYHYKSEDVMKESQMIQAFDKWAREEGINSFHLEHCWDAWQAALALNAADRDVMRETLEEERRKFRLETLRTSEQAKLLGEVAEVLRLRHDPGPWSRGCSECDLVERIDELLARPLNVPTPPAEQQGLADLIAALRGGRQCDEEGSEIIMSRQACVEAANFIEGAPTKKDSNNYCLILRELGMEEEGDPVAEVRRLKEKDEHHVSPSARELDMAMAIRRIVSSARRNCEDGSNVLKLANEAWSYLVRQGLEGSPLRDAGIASDSTVEQQGEQKRITTYARQSAAHQVELTAMIEERDHREEIIDQLCDAVLGQDRTEWSSNYYFEDAVAEVQERILELEERKACRDSNSPVLPSSALTALRAKVEALPADSDRPGFVWRKTVLAEIDKMGGGT